MPDFTETSSEDLFNMLIADIDSQHFYEKRIRNHKEELLRRLNKSSLFPNSTADFQAPFKMSLIKAIRAVAPNMGLAEALKLVNDWEDIVRQSRQ